MGGKTVETDSKGIPLKGPTPEGVRVPVFYAVMNAVFGAIGYVAAYFWAYSAAKHEVADIQIQIVAQFNLGWLYLGILMLKNLQLPIGVMLTLARNEAKIHLPNQHVYKVMGTEGSKLGYVLMENEGTLGDFNRAQRALQNYVEQFATLFMLYIAASWVFPREAFVCATIWAVSRIMSASGYKTNVDGRMGGMVIGVLAASVLQGMIILVAIKTLMLKSRVSYMLSSQVQ